MILAAVAAALVLAAPNKDQVTAKTAPTLTITDIKLSDDAASQSPANATVQTSTSRSQTPADIHIRLIDPAADIEAEVLQWE